MNRIAVPPCRREKLLLRIIPSKNLNKPVIISIKSNLWFYVSYGELLDGGQCLEVTQGGFGFQ